MKQVPLPSCFIKDVVQRPGTDLHAIHLSLHLLPVLKEALFQALNPLQSSGINCVHNQFLYVRIVDSGYEHDQARPLKETGALVASLSGCTLQKLVKQDNHYNSIHCHANCCCRLMPEARFGILSVHGDAMQLVASCAYLCS